MLMELRFNLPGAEAYTVETNEDLSDAIESEARTVAAEAGSDELETGSDRERDELRQRTVKNATASLTRPGDKYRDVLGTVWYLVEVED